MMGTDSFFLAVARDARAVVTCERCLSAKAGLPHPAWVGPRYVPGHGVAIVLQNPGAEPEGYDERALQKLLRRLEVSPPDAEAYRQYATARIKDMKEWPWPTWRHPVSKAIDGCFEAEEIAWLNVVYVRTPTGVRGRKDQPLTGEAIQHGLWAHLKPELELLRPTAVVTIGSPAREALDQLKWRGRRFHLKLRGATSGEAYAVRDALCGKRRDAPAAVRQGRPSE